MRVLILFALLVGGSLPCAAQQRTYAKTVNAGQLREELVAAIPALAGTGTLDVFASSTSVMIDALDSVSAGEIDAVVAAHVPAAVWPPISADQADLATLASQLDADLAAWDGLSTANKLVVAKKLLRREVLKRRLGR